MEERDHFEIPKNVRSMAEASFEQARKTFEKFIEGFASLFETRFRHQPDVYSKNLEMVTRLPCSTSLFTPLKAVQRNAAARNKVHGSGVDLTFATQAQRSS